MEFNEKSLWTFQKLSGTENSMDDFVDHIYANSRGAE